MEPTKAAKKLTHEIIDYYRRKHAIDFLNYMSYDGLDKENAKFYDEWLKEQEEQLPEQICFDFIFQRIQWALAIGFEQGRKSLWGGKMVVQMTMTGKTLRVFATGMDASRALNISVGMISDVCRGKRKSAKGCTFRFLNPNDYYTHIKKK